MSVPPRPDFEKIRRSYAALRQYKNRHDTERLHRLIITLLTITGFLGWMFIGHLRFLLFVAVLYFIIAVWRGNITFTKRTMPRRRLKRWNKYHATESQNTAEPPPTPP